MTVAIIRPNGDITNQWMVPGYALVDNVVTYPSTDFTDCIQADGWLGGDNNQVEIFNFEDLSDVEEVTQIKIYTLGEAATDVDHSYSNYPELRYSINGGVDWSSVHDCTGHLFHVGAIWGTNGTWDVWTISGISLTQTHINAIRLEITADVPYNAKGDGSGNDVYVVYIEVTYTGVAGYAHKVNGVLPDHIAKINGVLTGNIAKVNGV